MDFGDNFEQQEVDPAAEFLAREQSALAGLEDDLNPPAAVPQLKTEGKKWAFQGPISRTINSTDFFTVKHEGIARFLHIFVPITIFLLSLSLFLP